VKATVNGKILRTWPRLAAMGVLLGAVLALRLVLGTTGFSLQLDLVTERFWRLLPAVIIGVALAGSGVSLQALLRNPLAEPFILGLSTGAAAGVMAQKALAYYLQIELSFSGAGALVGAIASMAVVLLLSRRQGVIDPLGLLLTGIVLATIGGALVMAFNAVSPSGLRNDLAVWMMGYLGLWSGGWTITIVGGVTAASLGVLLWQAPAMDVATLSEAEARSIGVNLAQLRLLLFLVAAVSSAGTVVLAGPIAFVGLIAPHLTRLLVGPRHQSVLIGAALMGPALVVAADVGAAALNWICGIGTLPIGVLTALLGGPVFLWLLRPQLGRAMS